jgi:hypothetical protein
MGLGYASAAASYNAGGGSSNGRTADSDSASLGSNPSPPATPKRLIVLAKLGFQRWPEMAPSCAVFALGWVRGPSRDTAARPQTACEADMSLSGFDLLTELGFYPRRVQAREHPA